MSKPGVMFYFEMVPCLKRLNLEEKGKLFEAILDYGQYGVVPELDGMCGLAWDFLQPKLDRDSERYERVLEQRAYAAYARQERKAETVPMSMEQWRLMYEPQRTATNGNELQRTATNGNENQRNDVFVIQTTNSKLQTQTQTHSTNPKLQSEHDLGNENTRSPFPEEDQVRLYCQEQGLSLDVSRFMNYYTATGWQVGNKPVKDWRALARLWAGKESADGKNLEGEFQYGTTV